MELKATVIGHKSGSQFTDKRSRIMLRIEPSDSAWSELSIPVLKLNLEEYPIDSVIWFKGTKE